jgi:hypothetical protein
MTTSPHSTRAARNESIFRALNEELGATATGSPSDVSGFVCECANIACTAVLAVPLAEYERIRAHADRFIVAPDESHVEPTLETVVAKTTEYWVVEKKGAAGAVAEALDPRG